VIVVIVVLRPHKPAAMVQMPGSPAEKELRI
jgi:hypothetical protein